MTADKVESKSRQIFSELTTSRGVVLTILPWPMFLQAQIEESMTDDGFAQPGIPTYDVEIVGGEKETHEHDKSTIKDDDEAIDLWNEYEDARNVYAAELGRRTRDWAFIKCVRLDEVTEEDWKDWEGEQRELGLKVPKSKIKKKVSYLRTQAIGTEFDVMEIIRMSFELALGESSLRRQAGGLFRASLEEQDSVDGAEADSSESDLDNPESDRSEVVQGIGDSETVGAQTE